MGFCFLRARKLFFIFKSCMSSYDLQGCKLHLCQKITVYYQNNNQKITSLTVYENNWGTIIAIQLLCITITIGCCIQQSLFVKGQGYSVTKVSENYFNVISTHAICCNSRVCSLGRLILSACIQARIGTIICVFQEGFIPHCFFTYIKIVKYRWV